jgi:hypothetical protein
MLQGVTPLLHLLMVAELVEATLGDHTGSPLRVQLYATTPGKSK